MTLKLEKNSRKHEIHLIFILCNRLAEQHINRGGYTTDV